MATLCCPGWIGRLAEVELYRGQRRRQAPWSSVRRLCNPSQKVFPVLASKSFGYRSNASFARKVARVVWSTSLTQPAMRDAHVEADFGSLLERVASDL